jgi:iron complex outermembrane receptor protein
LFKTALSLLLVAQVMFTMGMAQYAHASDEQHVVHLRSITVTAEKVESLERDTAISMSVVSDETIEKTSTDTLDLVQQVPNLHMIRAGHHSGASFFSMRGVTPFMEGEQPVGFFVDGIFQHTLDTQLMDVERVEVLRGSQATLYGRNTEAGAINVITRPAEPESEGELSATVGNYGERRAQAIVGGALGSDELAYRAALRWQTNDGYFTQDGTGNNEVNDLNDINGRFKLRYQPNEMPLDVTVAHDASVYRDGSTSFAPLSRLYSDPHRIASDFVGDVDVDLNTTSVNALWQAPGFTITSITAYTDENKQERIDVDFTALDMMRLGTEVDQQRVTQELRISSPENAHIRWVGGLYYFDDTTDNNVDFEMRNQFTQRTRTTTDTRNVAVFGQVHWPLAKQWELTTGLRYDNEDKDVHNRQFYDPAFTSEYQTVRSLSYDAWLPKVSLQYRPDEGTLAYLSYSEGYKAGGFNNLSPAGEEVYQEEYTINYELGLKKDWFDGNLETRTALFWIDWEDQQVEELILNESRISNAGESVSRGIELEVNWWTTDDLRLHASYGWNDAHFERYIDGNNNYADKRPPNSPEYTWALGGEYTFLNDWYARADLLGTSNFYFDAANAQQEMGYELLNLRFGYDVGKYSIAAWVKNATDEIYATRAFDAGDGSYVGLAGDPRTFGVTVTTRW